MIKVPKQETGIGKGLGESDEKVMKRNEGTDRGMHQALENLILSFSPNRKLPVAMGMGKRKYANRFDCAATVWHVVNGKWLWQFVQRLPNPVHEMDTCLPPDGTLYIACRFIDKVAF